VADRYEQKLSRRVQARLTLVMIRCRLFVTRRIQMKRMMISALALSLLAGAAGTASAQPYGNHDRHDNDGHHGQHWDRGDNGGHYGRDWHARSEWRRGGYVGGDDWRRARAIDYRRYHLRHPPRGYEWREVDGRYVMVAVASGLIADIILNSR
jgi:Ni/Co efflux regulator RcnB